MVKNVIGFFGALIIGAVVEILVGIKIAGMLAAACLVIVLILLLKLKIENLE